MTAPREQSAREVLEARLCDVARVKMGRFSVDARGVPVWPNQKEAEAARQEWFALRALPYWWCRQCGKRFQRTMDAQMRCPSCIGWKEADVHCRRCGGVYRAQLRGHRTRRLCPPCWDAEHAPPVYFCMKCGTPHNRGNADYCERCEGAGHA